jgi:hypothetical protein
MSSRELSLRGGQFALAWALGILAGAAVITQAEPAQAELDDMGDEAEPSDETADAEEGTSEESAEATPAPEESPASSTADTGEALAAKSWDPDELQFEVGARGRVMVVPKFLINAFRVDGATDLVVGGIGAEGGISQGSFEGLLGVWYAGYNTAQVPFKGPNDGEQGWEMIKSNLGMLYITTDLLFRGKIAKDWRWFVGAGLGVGVVTGSLQRNETYWATPGGVPGNPYTQLALCNGPGATPFEECPGPLNNDNRYDIVTNQTSPAWSIYPWVTYQMGVRYQPIKQFIGRLDLGVGSSGFWLGLGADYGI